MMRSARTLAALVAACTALASVSSGYYHFTHYFTRSAPYTPVVEKFDLNALPNKTAIYYISEGTNVQLAPGDTFAGLVSQIRAAAKVWNDVDTSDLRLQYGGLIAPSTQQSSPAIQILFEEVPPGLVALGGTQVRADYNGSFIPIVRSVVIVRPELAQKPSYGEELAGTLVHEMGHALGLQHTLTSSTMSTAITRSTSKAKPLASDDIAGISVLYPGKTFGISTGSISGRVTLNGQGVNLASVVALSPGGPAVSALTNPDGTYRMDGLAPRQYLIYVHPLPPPLEGQTTPAGIIPPADPDGRAIPASGPFETQFYPATKDPQQSFPIQVTAGVAAQGINFAVRSRAALQLHSVRTYSYPSNSYVAPAYLNPAIPYPFIVATGEGLTRGSSPVPGLGVSVISGTPLAVKPYSDGYLEMDVDVRSFLGTSDSARHLLFSLSNDIYVLPFGYYQAQNQPPSITSLASAVDPNGSTMVVVSGKNLAADTRILFDGLPAITRAFDDSGRLFVSAPPAAGNYRANVVALNSDGQSSLFTQGDAVPTFTYSGADGTGAYVSATPNSLAAGTDALVQIDGVNTNFVDGQTVVGFGSSDVVVRRLWWISSTRVLVNVSVSPGASPGPGLLSVTSGLQLISQPFGFQVLPPNQRLLSVSSQVLNAATGQPGVQAGSLALLNVLSSPVPVSSSTLSLTLNDKPLSILSTNGNQITFQIPSNLPPGFVSLRLDGPVDRGIPVGLNIDAAPAQIATIQTLGNQMVDLTHAAHPGDILSLLVTGLDPNAIVSAGRTTVNVGGIDIQASQAVAQGNAVQIFIALPLSESAGNQVNVVVTIDGQSTAPAFISIRSS